MTGKLGWARQEGVRAPVDNAGRRQFAFAQEKDVHDERLWMGITKATGALGNTSCLVGTAEQVADAILGYYRLGVSSFLIRDAGRLPTSAMQHFRQLSSDEQTHSGC